MFPWQRLLGATSEFLSILNDEILESGHVYLNKASSWLTTLPLDWLGYTLNRQEFRDGIAMRYNWKIKDMPAYCGCGKENDIDHSLTSKKGGFVILRHNNIREEVCYYAQIEPRLIPISGENEEVYDAVRGNVAERARLDVAARGVWSQYDRSFVDVRVTTQIA